MYKLSTCINGKSNQGIIRAQIHKHISCSIIRSDIENDNCKLSQMIPLKTAFLLNAVPRKIPSCLMTSHAGIPWNLRGNYGTLSPKKTCVITFQKNAHKIRSFLRASVGARHGGGSFELQMKFIKSNGALLLEPNKVIQTRAGRIRDCLLVCFLDSSAIHPTHICVHMGNISFRQPSVFLEILEKCYIWFTYFFAILFMIKYYLLAIYTKATKNI